MSRVGRRGVLTGLAGEVRAAMARAWGEYRRLGRGKDEIRPVSGDESPSRSRGVISACRQADHCPGDWWSEQFHGRRNDLSTEGDVLRGSGGARA